MSSRTMITLLAVVPAFGLFAATDISESLSRTDVHSSTMFSAAAEQSSASWIYATPLATGQSCLRLGMDVSAGRSLEVGLLTGGRRDFLNNPSDVPGIDKTGVGSLVLNDLFNYGGDIRIGAGSVVFNRRQIPGGLPADPYLRLDASDPSIETVVSNGVLCVTRWKSSGTAYTGTLYAVPYTDSPLPPKFCPDALGPGRPVVDLGAFGAKSGTFGFRDGSALESEEGLILSDISTLVAVIGVQNGGGHLFNRNFRRNSDGAVNATTGLLRDDVTGTAYVDGLKADKSEGYPHAGYVTVALRVPAGSVWTLGRTSQNYSGGLRIAELVAYNRDLTDQEMKDASAYLADKWFARTLPGYASKSGTTGTDVSAVAIKGDGCGIGVEGAGVVRVASFSADTVFEKTGSGRLEVPSVRDTGDYAFVKGGALTAAARPDPAQCEMAAGPALHLDASKTNQMDIWQADDKSYISAWYDADRFANFAFQSSGNALNYPFLRTDAEALLNGRPVVDFGDLWGNGRFLNFAVPLDSVRSVFYVGDLSKGGALLGSSASNATGVDLSAFSDFARGDNGALFYPLNDCTHITGGDHYVNGVKVEYDAVVGGYQLVDTHTLANATASGFPCWRSKPGVTRNKGGAIVGELLIYTRELTPRERVATRNYLRRKWFPNEPLEALPDEPKTEPDHLPVYLAEVDATAGAAVSGSRDTVVKRLTGGGALEKTGNGRLSVVDMSSFSGRVTVKEGVLVLSGDNPLPAADVVEDGRIFHADATYGVETNVTAKGVVEVVRWTSRHDSAYTAVPGYDTEGNRPTLRPYGGANSGLFAVDMAPNANQCMLFCKDGSPIHLPETRSVFWVIGSQNGGGYLLGGGNPDAEWDDPQKHYNFMRGWTSADGSECDLNPSMTLLHVKNADWALRNYGTWFKNGVQVDPNTVGLSGDWDQLSLVMENGHTDAEGFAFNGNCFVTPQWATVTGCQRLSEVIVYDRCLTPEERIRNENYLRTKWGVGVKRSANSAAAVELSAGTVLDCAGKTQRLGLLTGAGTVENGTVAAGALVADATATAWPTVTGTFSISKGQSVEVRNLSADLLAGDGEIRIRILQAAAFDGLENLGSVQVTGITVPTGRKASVRVAADGWLYLKIRSCGTMLMVR